MNRDEWKEEYGRLADKPLAPYLKAVGFSDDELRLVPARTMGELAGADVHSLYDKMDFFKHRQLLYLAQKVNLLPVIAECALAGNWEDFSTKVQVMYETMPEAFSYFYDDMPEEYKRDFVIGCYQHHGDSVEECREALQELRARGREELPEEYRSLEEMTVYRAGEESIDEAKEYFSWTLDLEVARWFMYEYGAKHATHIFKAHIKPSDVIAYTDERGEREVIQYLSVYDVEIVEMI